MNLKKIHDNKILFCMIAPDNICVSEDIEDQNIYFKDFDFSIRKKILNDTDKKIKINKFSSFNNHLGIYPCYRDDLESVVYLLIYFVTEGRFLDNMNYEQRKNFKQCFFIEKMMDILPEEIIVIFNYVRKLSPNEFPAYDFIFGLFESFFSDLNLEKDFLEYCWVTKIFEDKKNKFKKKKRKFSAKIEFNKKQDLYKKFDSCSVEMDQIKKKLSLEIPKQCKMSNTIFLNPPISEVEEDVTGESFESD